MNMWLVIIRSGANNGSIYIQTMFISTFLYAPQREEFLEYFGDERS